MKLSCLPVSFFWQLADHEMSIREWAQIGREVGLDGIDLSVLFLESMEADYLDNTRKQIEKLGLQVAMISTYPDFTHPREEERRSQIEGERRAIRAAGRLGAELVRITSGQAHPGLAEEDGIRWALEGLRACEDDARRAGVRLALENHGKPGCWQYTDFDQPTPVFLALAEGIKDSQIGINFDTANPVVAGDDPLRVLQKVIDQVICIHAADTGSAETLEHVLLGSGLVRFPEVFAFLKSSGYDGWISMEEGSGLGRKGVGEAAAFVRRAWAEA
jgi:sugar phosphate isomerase/epimerase